MAAGSVGWAMTFLGCDREHPDCDSGRFEVRPAEGATITVEVRTTAQVEQILARELGKNALAASDREAILSVAGRQLIEESLAATGTVQPVVFLDSRLFRVAGAERQLLRACGLLSG